MQDNDRHVGGRYHNQRFQDKKIEYVPQDTRTCVAGASTKERDK